MILLPRDVTEQSRFKFIKLVGSVFSIAIWLKNKTSHSAGTGKNLKATLQWVQVQTDTEENQTLWKGAKHNSILC